MRSRYAADVVGNLDHLERTAMPEALQAFNRLDAERVVHETIWLGLEVRRVVGGTVEDQTGQVECLMRLGRIQMGAIALTRLGSILPAA